MPSRPRRSRYRRARSRQQRSRQSPAAHILFIYVRRAEFVGEKNFSRLRHTHTRSRIRLASGEKGCVVTTTRPNPKRATYERNPDMAAGICIFFLLSLSLSSFVRASGVCVYSLLYIFPVYFCRPREESRSFTQRTYTRSLTLPDKPIPVSFLCFRAQFLFRGENDGATSDVSFPHRTELRMHAKFPPPQN